MRHTLGPWNVIRYNDGFYKVTEAQEQLDPETADALPSHDSLEIDDANARIIAAAPDMLAVIELAITYIEDGAPLTALDRLKRVYQEVTAK